MLCAASNRLVEARVCKSWNKFRQVVFLLTNKDVSLLMTGKLCGIWLRSYMLHGSETWPTRMWANAQPDGRPAEHRWRPLFNAAKFG